MDDSHEQLAGESKNLLAIARFGQSKLTTVIDQAWGGLPLPQWDNSVDFTTPISKRETTIDGIPLILITGGKPVTIHAKGRYQVQEILKGTEAVQR